MFKKILVGLDGSEDGEAALRYAVELAKKDGAHLYLLRSANPAVSPLGHTPALADTHTLVRGYLSRKKKELLEDGLEAVTILTRIGNPARGLLSAAKKLQADLIVVGTAQRHGIDGRLFASVARKVMRQANCPTLVVPKA